MWIYGFDCMCEQLAIVGNQSIERLANPTPINQQKRSPIVNQLGSSIAVD